MEERGLPTKEGDANAGNLSATVSLRLPPPPGRSSETYVVQIPRDQVYRVPPPENARIVESYRKPSQKKNRCGCCCWILFALLMLGIVIGIVIAVIHALYNPKCPNFSITRVQFKNVTEPTHGRAQKKNHPQPQPHSHPQFQIDMKIENINRMMDVSFGDENNGKSTILFKKHEIGQGKYPSISQITAKDSTNVHINLDVGSHGKLPGDFQKSLGDNDKKLIPMTLRIHTPIEITSWAKKLKKDLIITCDFDVVSLTKKSKIKFEECRTNF